MKIEYDTIIVLVLVGSFLWLGNASLWNHTLDHPYPLGLGASDAFQHQSRAEAIKNMGQYRGEAYYMMNGYHDVVGFYPPALYHISVLLSHASGLEVYDTLFFLVFFMVMLAAVVMYLTLKLVNSVVAILAIPMFFFLYLNPFYIGYIFGQWPAIAGHVYLITALWTLAARPQGWWILFGILSAGSALTHTAGTIFLGLFVAGFGAYLLLKRNWIEVKNLVAGGIIGGVLASYYLLIFRGTWSKFQTYELFTIEYATNSFPTIMPHHFDWTAWVIGAGILLFFASFKKMKTAAVGCAVLALAGLTNFIGLGFRAFQVRFMWPIYLGLFFALVFYFPSRFFGKWKLIYALAISIGLSLFILTTHDTMGPSNGLMDQNRWDGMQWIADNTPPDSIVYFFYGDLYYQTSMLYNTERVSTIVDQRSYVETVINQSVFRKYRSMRASDSGAGFPYRQSAFTFKFHAQDNSSVFEGAADLCLQNYWIFETRPTYQQSIPIIQNNFKVRDMLLQHGEEVYSNEIVSIVRNNNVGGDCL